jgi:DNA-binding MarR family transcriptional regulator
MTTSSGRRRPTRKQRQLLAYVYWYTKVHRIPPSENELAEFLAVRGPSAHRMIVTLAENGLLARTAGEPNTLRVLVPRAEPADLD